MNNTSIGEEYRNLLEQLKDIATKIKSIESKNVIFEHCNNVIPYEDIDPLSIVEESHSDYFEAWADYYVKCNEPNICKQCTLGWCSKKERIDDKVFDKILKVHNMTYSEWLHAPKKKKKKK